MGKTESILFGSKQKLNKQGHVNLNITCGNIIQSKSQVKYLGVELDQFLSGDCITTKIVGKSIAKLKFLYRQAKHFDMGTRKTLVSTLIQCHMDYACSAWYTGLSKRNKIVHGPESENLPPPPGNFRDPPSFLPEGVLYSFPGVVNHINAANMQKYDFLYKPH